MRTEFNIQREDFAMVRGRQERGRPARESVTLTETCGRAARAPIGGRSAFSLIEIIVVVGLLTVIMLGLMMMFNQTQRVFQTGITQVDVLDAGRAASGLLAREMEQITPSHLEDTVNFFSLTPAVTIPLVQPLPGTGSRPRTNVMQEVFFLTRENQTWTGIGYRAYPADEGIGKLYRFVTNSNTRNPHELFQAFNDAITTNMSPVLDGVMHFKVRAYDTNGYFIRGNIGPDIYAEPSTSVGGEIYLYGFTNSAVPAAVEFELGILENRIYDRAKALPTSTPYTSSPRYRYLTNQVGRLHVFRQLVPIRNVDPGAYQ